MCKFEYKNNVPHELLLVKALGSPDDLEPETFDAIEVSAESYTAGIDEVKMLYYCASSKFEVYNNELYCGPISTLETDMTNYYTKVEVDPLVTGGNSETVSESAVVKCLVRG